MTPAKKTASAGLVKELREKTGASVMDCKKSLEKAKGDIEEAVKLLKAQGKEKADKKSARETTEGAVACYVHGNRKIGAMVELRCETDFVAKNEEFLNLAHDLAMHVAAMAPAYLSAEKVSQSEKKEYERIVREDLASEKKPEEIIEKIVAGKVKKHFEQNSLLSQEFIKNPDATVDELIKERISKIGENIQVVDFSRFEI